MSQNSIISHDGKACAHCPYNDFGSKDGERNAKACKELVLLFLLRPNSIIPLLVHVPVTSKPRFLKYSTRLLSTLTPISSVVTKITLEKATSKQGKPYALFNFQSGGDAGSFTFGGIFMNYGELKQVFQELKRTSPSENLTAHIIFTEDSFATQYPLLSHTYRFDSDNKAFWPSMGGYSIFACCLDITSNQGVRLDWYMEEEGNPGGWKVEECYILEQMRDTKAIPNLDRV